MSLARGELPVDGYGEDNLVSQPLDTLYYRAARSLQSFVDHPACKVTANSKVVRPDVKFGPPLSTLFDGRQYPAVSRPGLSAGEELWLDLSSQGARARQYGQDYLVAVT